MPEKISLVRKMLENLKKLEESTLVLRYYIWTQRPSGMGYHTLWWNLYYCLGGVEIDKYLLIMHNRRSAYVCATGKP
jgi:hypothetical protein